MSFMPVTALVVAAAAEHLPRGAKVVDLGNQRFRASKEVIDRIAATMPDRADSLHALLAPASRSEVDARTVDYFRALGFASYAAIDVNSEFGSLVMDLNRPLREAYGFADEFDLVINNGTGEHVFNQYELVRNMHNLCRKGGLMLHIVPFINYLNHGFYNFNPLLYCDLALANGYAIEAIGIGNRWGDVRILAGESKTRLLPRDEIPFEVLRRSIHGRGDADPFYMRARKMLSRRLRQTSPPSWHRLERIVADIQEASRRRDKLAFGNVLVIALLRKQTADDFVSPFQGKYVGAIEDRKIMDTYAGQSALEPILELKN